MGLSAQMVDDWFGEGEREIMLLHINTFILPFHLLSPLLFVELSKIYNLRIIKAFWREELSCF